MTKIKSDSGKPKKTAVKKASTEKAATTVKAKKTIAKKTTAKKKAVTAKEKKPSKKVKEKTEATVEAETKVSKKGKYDPRNKLNDLISTEWIPETISVWNQKGLGAKHPDVKIEKQHPAPFSFTDVARLIRFFTKKKQTVLDPFVGIGSTLKACALEKRKGIGIELNPKYADLALERIESEVSEIKEEIEEQLILEGDSREVLDTLDENSVDFVVTSPPYWNILHKKDHKVKQEREKHSLDTKYSDHESDLGNIHDYPEFLDDLTGILGKCARILKPEKYMAVIVSDFRDKSKYIMFHADLARSLEPFGLEMRGLKVLYQRHKRIFPYGYPYAYVPNIHNQYILILQNAKK
ncbi:DNA methyltransferase [Aliikangiella sp. IMCC44653]